MEDKQQDSSPIKNVDEIDSMDDSAIDAMNEEEKQALLKQERERSIEIISSLKAGISNYE